MSLEKHNEFNGQNSNSSDNLTSFIDKITKKQSDSKKVSLNENVNPEELDDLEWIVQINYVNRPSDALLNSYIITNQIESGRYLDEEALKELVTYWDSIFYNSETDTMEDKIEEWIEAALQVKVACQILKKVYILTPLNNLPRELSHLPVLGAIGGFNSDLFEMNNNINNDLVFPELKEYLGREINICKADKSDILATADKMLQKHGVIYPKWLGKSKIYPVRPIRSVDEMHEWLMFDPYMLEVQYFNKLTLQEGLELENEVRFFVVDGKIATYSLNKWYLTPLHQQPKIDVRQQHDFAQKVIEKLKEGDSLTNNTYVLDVAFDKKYNRCVVVELNQIHNSGFYGINLEEYIRAAKNSPQDFVLRQI